MRRFRSMTQQFTSLIAAVFVPRLESAARLSAALLSLPLHSISCHLFISILFFIFQFLYNFYSRLDAIVPHSI